MFNIHTYCSFIIITLTEHEYQAPPTYAAQLHPPSSTWFTMQVNPRIVLGTHTVENVCLQPVTHWHAFH